MKRRPNNGAESNSALQANIGSVRKVGFTLWSTFKTLVIVLVVCISLSKLLTDSFAWGYDRSLWRVKKWIKVGYCIYTETGFKHHRQRLLQLFQIESSPRKSYLDLTDPIQICPFISQSSNIHFFDCK
jgi:hypothetical protein